MLYVGGAAFLVLTLFAAYALDVLRRRRSRRGPRWGLAIASETATTVRA